MRFQVLLGFVLLITACTTSNRQQREGAAQNANNSDTLQYPQETHLRNVRQLTYGGDNAEGYFSFNSSMITFQRRNKSENLPCDQIFTGKLPKGNEPFEYHMISTGGGRTTCSFFMPGNDRILFASTHARVDSCIADPDKSKGYLWGVYDSYEIYIADLHGHILRQLTNNNFYDAEGVVSPKGDKILFTSNRSGDLELWTMDLEGGNLQQITNQLGYDGGAFFSPDGSKIVFRASRPQTEEEIATYKDLLRQGFVKPTAMELFICNADGSELRQITHLGGANWAPYFHPSGNKIIFSSNHTTKRIPFNLYMINLDGTGLEQITFDTIFDSFAMFSPDGKKLIFASNRNAGGTHDTNLFIADWVE